MRIPIRLLAAVIAATAIPAHADSLRCGNDLVRPGDGVTTVLDDCGNPKRTARLVNGYGNQVGTVMYFSPGFGQADRRVVFRGGRVDAIERLD